MTGVRFPVVELTFFLVDHTQSHSHPLPLPFCTPRLFPTSPYGVYWRHPRRRCKGWRGDPHPVDSAHQWECSQPLNSYSLHDGCPLLYIPCASCTYQACQPATIAENKKKLTRQSKSKPWHAAFSFVCVNTVTRITINFQAGGRSKAVSPCAQLMRSVCQQQTAVDVIEGVSRYAARFAWVSVGSRA